jgi:hypothetical protein
MISLLGGEPKIDRNVRKISVISLTKRIVDAANPHTKRYHIWDSELSGFGLRIEPSGVKTFLAKYRAEGGGRRAPERRITIGRYGILTADEARKQAKKILGGAATGADPAAEIKSKRKEMRITDLINLYEKEGCFVQRGKRQGQPMKPLTKQYTIARLGHHVVTLLGSRRVTEINAGDIERFFRDVEAGKTAKDEKIAPRRRVIVRGDAGGACKAFASYQMFSVLPSEMRSSHTIHARPQRSASLTIRMNVI